MKLFQKPIFTGFMPNMERKDVALALSFFLPWKWKKLRRGNSILNAEITLQNYFSCLSATTFDSGRSSLYFSLQALGVKQGDEVLVQAYTCGVVSNAILWTGATPVYVDITDNFILDTLDLRKKITPRAKVLVIQHTFGIPADLPALLTIAKENNLKVVEDCAHVMGGRYQGKLLGTFGDIGMLSFGADKALSCGRGGALITNDSALAQKIKSLHEKLPLVPIGTILKQLFTFFVFFISKPLYNLGIGKWKLGLAKKFHITTRIIEPQEKEGSNLPFYPAQLPNSFARLLLLQMKKIASFNTKRLEWGRKYKENLPTQYRGSFPAHEEIVFLRFPILVQKPHILHEMAKEEGILLGDWYNAPIAPKDMKSEQLLYKQGSCPQAEALAKKSVNLPTHCKLTPHDFERIMMVIEKYERTHH